MKCSILRNNKTGELDLVRDINIPGFVDTYYPREWDQDHYGSWRYPEFVLISKNERPKFLLKYGNDPKFPDSRYRGRRDLASGLNQLCFLPVKIEL